MRKGWLTMNMKQPLVSYRVMNILVIIVGFVGIALLMGIAGLQRQKQGIESPV
jgi:hypothetical protein